jgi:predicted DNA-binding transcriptional regulator AlpA
VIADTNSLVAVFSDLAAVGRKLVETSEVALAILQEREAECRPSADEREHATLSMTMSATETAEALGVGTRTLRRMRAAGEGPKPVKIRGALRYRRTAVETWLARKQA